MINTKSLPLGRFFAYGKGTYCSKKPWKLLVDSDTKKKDFYTKTGVNFASVIKVGRVLMSLSRGHNINKSQKDEKYV